MPYWLFCYRCCKPPYSTSSAQGEHQLTHPLFPPPLPEVPSLHQRLYNDYIMTIDGCGRLPHAHSRPRRPTSTNHEAGFLALKESEERQSVWCFQCRHVLYTTRPLTHHSLFPSPGKNTDASCLSQGHEATSRSARRPILHPQDTGKNRVHQNYAFVRLVCSKPIENAGARSSCVRSLAGLIPPIQ
jgi:hypothetical protein